jgi:hypothetical protein
LPGGLLSDAWNAVTGGASAAWDAATSTASSAVSAVGNGASSLMHTVSEDASAAWNAVGDGAVSVKDAIVHGDSDWTKNTELEQQAFQRQMDEQKARDANPEIQKFRKAQMDQGAHEVGAKDAGFDNAQHMQDYSKARQDFERAWDKINSIKDSDEAEKMRQQLGVPKSLDDYLRQQHISPRGTPAY